jgi:flotillin
MSDFQVTLVVAGVVALLVVIVLVSLFRASWRIAEPDEALIISAVRGGHTDGMGFRIVTGRGTFVVPGLVKVRTLSLMAHESEITVPCVSQQKIRLDLRGVVVYKVGDDNRSIANAARRFLDRPAQELESKVMNVFVGHLRAIAGSMTVEEMISDQDKFAQQVRERCTVEMESFGLVIDSFQIQAITSPSAYIENLAVPHQAEVEQNARIARAQADQTAVAQEQTAQAQIAESIRSTEIKKAGFQAEIDKAQKQAAQQGPLADAQARQAVVEQETRVAALQAERTEQQLQVDVRKPADAEAYRQTTLAAAARDVSIRQAEAEAQKIKLAAEAQAGAVKVQAHAQAEATRLNGQADADAIRARGLADADAIRARTQAEAAGIESRAAALSQNQEAVIAQQIAQTLPDIVRAAASPFEHVGQFTVLNGAQGVTSALAEVIQQAGVLAAVARRTITPLLEGDTSAKSGSDGGAKSATPAEDVAQPRPARTPRPAASAAPAVPAAPATASAGAAEDQARPR